MAEVKRRAERSYFVVASLKDEGEVGDDVPDDVPDAIAHDRLDHKHDSLVLVANRPPPHRNFREIGDQVTTSLAGDDQLFVAWKRLNRGIETGVASPGRPFEFLQNGIRLRVEAREVVPGNADEVTDDRVTLAALPRLQAEMAQKAVQAGHRHRIRELREQFHAMISAHRESIFESVAPLKALPAIEVARAIETAERGISDREAHVQRSAIELLARADVGPDDIQELNAIIQEAQRQCVEIALRPKQLADARLSLTKTTELTEHAFDLQEKGLALVARAIAGSEDRAPKKSISAAQKLFRRNRQDARERARQLSQSSDLTQAMVHDIAAEPAVLERTLIREMRDLKSVLPGNEIKAALRHGTILRGVLVLRPVTNPKGEIRTFEVWLRNDGDAPWIAEVAIKNHDRYAGTGLRPMSVPDRGDAAMQQIKCYRTYGERPRPGTVITLFVLGYGYIDVALPERGHDLIVPLSKLTIEGNGNLAIPAHAINERNLGVSSESVFAFSPGKSLGRSAPENIFEPARFRVIEVRRRIQEAAALRARLVTGNLPEETERLLEQGTTVAGFGVAHFRRLARGCAGAIIRRTRDPLALSPDSERDLLELEAIESELSALSDIHRRIEKELRRCGAAFDVDPTRRVSGLAFVPPTLTYRVLRSHGDGRFDLEVCAQNNQDRALRVDLRCGGETVRKLAFEGRGRSAVTRLERVRGPIQATVDAIAATRSRPSFGQSAVDCTNVFVSSPEFGLHDSDVGVDRRILPFMFTPGAKQPRGRTSVILEEKGSGKYSTAFLPAE